MGSKHRVRRVVFLLCLLALSTAELTARPLDTVHGDKHGYSNSVSVNVSIRYSCVCL